MIHSLLLARKDDEFPSDYRFLDERFFPRELDELDEESLPLDDDELDEYDDELVELPLVLPLLDELDDDPDEELELLDRRLFRRFFFSPNAALNRRSSTPTPSGTWKVPLAEQEAPEMLQKPVWPAHEDGHVTPSDV